MNDSETKDVDRPHWVCRECIGTDEFWEYEIGLIGVEVCEVCGRLFRQPPLAFVSHAVFLQSMKREDRCTQK